ncbi:MAG TPA: DUF1015 domain-containing protein [Thermodesulfovibrionales bacterium]|nr:DUF1015 domain-containing protein [Thermodesulfovibrionales bacterium]
MAEVIPFRGVMFNVPKLSKRSGEELLAPPYDIITPEEQQQLYDKSPYNIVRIDFGRKNPEDDEQDNRYSRARASLEGWLQEDALVVSKTPCFYAYEIAYVINNAQHTLRGVLGLVRLEALGKGNIHPHEYTHSKPKKDRLDLMRYCEANVSPIFSLYNAPEKRTSRVLAVTASNRPYIEAKDNNGAVHRLWQIEDRTAVSTITEELQGKAVFIADGHHRYETALEYEKEMQKKEGTSGGRKPYDYVLMFLANMADEGLTILPTHRLVKDLPQDAFDQLSADFDIEKMGMNDDIPSSIAGKRDVYGFYTGGDAWYRLSYKGEGIHGVPAALKDLDVTILHDLIFKQLLDIEKVSYEMDVQKCLQAVSSGEFSAAFFLNPTGVYDVERVALASLRMPPKSTYFYPKLMTGMVLNIFKNSF